MNIQECRDEVKSIESSIESIIETFEKQFDVSVESIYVRRVTLENDKSFLQNVKLVVNLQSGD